MITRMLKGLKILTILSIFGGCTTEENFPQMGSKFNGVVSIKNITISGQNYMLALSSDYDRSYNKGSIQLLEANSGSTEPNKLSLRDIDRLGRTLDTYENYALVTYDAVDNGSFGKIQLYRYDDTSTSSLVKEWTLDCSPTNAVFSSSGKYIAASCFGGTMYVGTMNTSDESQININKVRDYNMTMRAMYFYNNGSSEILYAFPAIFQYPTIDDRYTADTKSYIPSDVSTFKDQPNGIPDAFENSDLSQRSISSRYPYQFIVYNVTKEASLSASTNTFRYIESGTAVNPTQADNERAFFTFEDANSFTAVTKAEDGVEISYTKAPGYKYYRTNFWDIKADPAGASSRFYISQRGDAESPDANNVFQVDIAAGINFDEILYRDFFDAEGYPQTIGVDDVLGTNALTRVFGLRESQGGKDINDDTYLTEIGFFQSSSNNEYYLLANSFRDIVFWGAGEQNSQVLIKPLGSSANTPGDDPLSNGLSETKSIDLLYGIAVSSELRLLSSDFYGESIGYVNISPKTGESGIYELSIEGYLK